MSDNNLKLLFFKNLNFSPNELQNQVIDHLSIFIKHQDKKQLYILKGYAGTGKTSILGAFVKSISELNIKSRLLSPTGRAAKVLSLNSGKQAFTIHKQLYRRKNTNDNFDNLSLSPNLFKNTIFIVDEASMISDYQNDLKKGQISNRNLLEDLIEYVYTGENCKLILLGDEGQLPPVGSDFSPALNLDYFRYNYPNIHVVSHTLTQVMRQNEVSLILENATNIRNQEINGYPNITLDHRHDLINITGDELQEKIEESIDKYGNDETIIITRSNKQANNYNFQFRSRILWYDEELSNNDILINVKNNYFWIDEQSKAGFIANGEIIQVKRILKREEQYGFQFIKAIVKLIDYPEIDEFETILFTEVLKSEGPNLNRDRMKELFFNIEEDYKDEKNKKKRYELILKNPYFNALQVKFGYAITCHKSQGGQWDSVFIDPGFLNEDDINESYYRWLYTAITRAKKQVYLVNFNEKYFQAINSD
jgi:exodeoxyribonuclease V